MTDSAPSTRGAAPAVIAILALSAAACAFLFWLIYHKPAAAATDDSLAFLPALNALLNTAAATCITIGIVLIKRGRRSAHRAVMLAAFGFSALFLVGYILHHHLHGDAKFPATVSWRHWYYGVLASHILLSIATLPLVLCTFYFALSGRLAAHRRLARWTYPVWLYVSVTGVLVFAMLRIAS